VPSILLWPVLIEQLLQRGLSFDPRTTSLAEQRHADSLAVRFIDPHEGRAGTTSYDLFRGS